MKKITFKEYLIEFDIGDRQLAQTHAMQQDQAASENQFKHEMTQNSPAKGDLIKSKRGMYMVMGMSKQGIHVKQAGGNKTGILPHGTNFARAGKNDIGKTIFTVAK